ncbi:Utp14 protein [Acanthamoeba castellanii str. Neff]|uniref:Utp14 protein n=1 Tax=Acanthamoeba castellanii (strain ATCC 30010 / Neff) TaxID=1257118 RepID=L8GE96_ACACF|nr:Utp14 protein [Acanthamoeba castellanii str. Neff]ELR11420.1 Utp14 protein [Acanthamoeba castellanii str. Neff]
MSGPSTEQFYPEGEFNLQPSGNYTCLTRVEWHPNKGMLTLDALMGSLKDELQYADVKRQLTELQKTKNLLAQPLDQPIKQKLTREEAYEKKKEEITDKWETTVRENRKADHLKFPFAEPAPEKLTAAKLALIDTPQNDLERGIADILAQSGVTKQAIDHFEGLDMNELSTDEVKQREAQIKKMKAVLFYEESKAKRRKKIKSKAYHRILKKQKQKSAMSLDELGQLDEETARAEAEKIERLRIQERITQRHKNKGKWAQRQLTRGHLDTETRQAISEQIKIRDQLLKKQMNANEDDDADIDDMNEEELQEALDMLEKEEAPQVTKGLMGMDFMKRGQKRRADEMREAKEEWERDMEEMMRQRDADSDDENLEAEAKAPEETEVKGRRTVQKDLGTTQAGSSGSSAPVKFSGATHQTEKAALSSGRTVRMSGHATIDVPALLKKGTKQTTKEPEIANIFAVEEFPDVEGAGPVVHDVNKTKDEVAAILKESEGQAESKRTNKKKKVKKANNGETPEKSKAAPARKQTPTKAAAVSSSASSEVDTQTTVEEEEALASPKPKGPLSVAHIKAPTARPQAVPDEEDEADHISTTTTTTKTSRHAPRNPEVHDMENPWMKRSSAATGVVAKKTAHSVITASHAGTTADDKVSKKQKKEALGKRQQAETTLKINVERLITDVASAQVKEHDDDRSGADSGNGSSSSFNLLASATEEQKELIKRAFANDDVVEEFKAAKRAELEADAPAPAKPTVMPGWGAWVGEGVTKPTRPPKKQPRIQKPKRAKDGLPVKPPTRTDDGLDHVIINQKRDKKFARYRADQLPSTFRKQPELYEAQLQTPLGREWNTQHVFNSITRPRIETKAGHIIRPISQPLAKKQKQEEDQGEPVNRGAAVAGNKRKRADTKNAKQTAKK